MAFTIDVHHQILPDFFWRATNDQHGPVGGIAPALWSLESAISFMDDAQIDVAITSTSTPGVHLGDDTAARQLARRCNEFFRCCARWWGWVRFSMGRTFLT
jgi:6-methylsalicylate decarboxylase